MSLDNSTARGTEMFLPLWVRMFGKLKTGCFNINVNTNHKTSNLEPQNILEMTRAWNTEWSPKNTMSVLFSYSRDQLKKIWDEDYKLGINDNKLQGITTTINPNLGFKGTTFRAVEFVEMGLRPIKYKYTKLNDEYIYTTRRVVTQNNQIESQVPLLPLNELVFLYNRKKLNSLKNSEIYIINSNKL